MMIIDSNITMSSFPVAPASVHNYQPATSYASNIPFDIPHTLSPRKSLYHLIHPPNAMEGAKETVRRSLPFLDIYKDISTQAPSNVEALYHNLHGLIHNKRRKIGRTSLYGNSKSKYSSSTSTIEEYKANPHERLIAPNGYTKNDGEPVVDVSNVIPAASIPVSQWTSNQTDSWFTTSGPTPVDPQSPGFTGLTHTALSLTNVVVSAKQPPSNVGVDSSAGRSTRNPSVDPEQSYCDFWDQIRSPSFQSFRKRSSSVIDEYEPLPQEELDNKRSLDASAVSYGNTVCTRSPSYSDGSQSGGVLQVYTDSFSPDENIVNEDELIPPTWKSRSRCPSPENRQPCPSRDDNDAVSENFSRVDVTAEEQDEDDHIKVLVHAGRLRMSSLATLDHALVTPPPRYPNYTRTESRIVPAFLQSISIKSTDPERHSESYITETANESSSLSFASEINLVEQAPDNGADKSDDDVEDSEKAGSLFSEESEEEDRHRPLSFQLSSNSRHRLSPPPPTPKPPTSSLPSPPVSECGASPRLDIVTPLRFLQLPPVASYSSSRNLAAPRKFIQTSHSKSEKRRRTKSATLFLPSSRATASRSRPWQRSAASSSSVRYGAYSVSVPVNIKGERRTVKPESSKPEGVRGVNMDWMRVVRDEMKLVKNEKIATTERRKKRKLIGSERVAAAEALDPQKRSNLQHRSKAVDRVMVAKWVAEICRLLKLSMLPAPESERHANGRLLLRYLLEIDERKDEIPRDLLQYPPGPDNLAVFFKKMARNRTIYDLEWPELGLKAKARALREYVIQREGLS